MPHHSNPYSDLPDFCFWRRAVAPLKKETINPCTRRRFSIDSCDNIASAGSCFAQHISRTLKANGYRYHVTEPGPKSIHATNEGYGVFPARFGNIYSVRQLLQLFKRAYGLFFSLNDVWVRPDGRFVDAFRPRVQSSGFPDEGAVRADRLQHLIAVREMFESCNVFIFTLGLTECWASAFDGAIFPLAPGVAGAPPHVDSVSFHNSSVAEMTRDLDEFFRLLRTVNPRVKIILTVSPVPLMATFESRHVLESTCYSKSALRVVADEALQKYDFVDYFPSYEIITGVQAGAGYFEDDLREVSMKGVDRVMDIFKATYLGGGPETSSPFTPDIHRSISLSASATQQDGVVEQMRQLQTIICDEEAIDPSASKHAPCKVTGI